MEFGVQRFAINLPKLLLPEPQVPMIMTAPESMPISLPNSLIFVFGTENKGSVVVNNYETHMDV